MAPMSADVLAVVDLQNQYAWAIDSKQYDLFDEVFAPELQATYGRAQFDGRAAITRYMERFHAHLSISQHTITNHHVELDGDVGSMRSYVIATLVCPDFERPRWRVGAYYLDSVMRLGADWRIASRVVKSMWSEGNAQVFEDGHRAGEAALGTRFQ